MDIGQLIADCRYKVGLSRRELARRAGTSASTLTAYEAGSKIPSVATLERILKATGHQLAIGVRPILGPDQPFPAARGREVADVLDLADRLPADHHEQLTYPLFPRR